MSSSKKPLGKRKRQSPPPSSTSQINRRLEKIRNGQRNLWDNDDDDDNVVQPIQPKPTTTDKTYVILSDSDDEKTSSRRRSKSNKPRKKSSRTVDENLTSDNDHKSTSKCATCLICSILTSLTSYNCCTKHLSLLINNKNTCQKLTTNTDQWSPQQVMIVPMTDELMQRYLNPQDIHRLRTQSSTCKKTSESNRTTRKISKKLIMTSEPSDSEHSNFSKPKSSAKCSHVESDQPSCSSITIGSAAPNPSDTTFTVIQSTSTTINSFESPTVLDTCQLQQSSDQPIIIIDDSQSDTQQENSSSATIQENKQKDPWTPVSDETYAAIDIVLDQPSQDQPEFTPATARRTPTEIMASRLPKIQLKTGRFRQGKPITDKSTPDVTTNESSPSTSSSVIITNSRPAPSLATIVEDESLIIQSTHQISDKPCQVLSERHENSRECLSDTVMSSLLAQDESSQHDHVHTTTKAISNEALPSLPLAIIIEDCSGEKEINKSADISQSSQLTNDQNDSEPLIPSNVNEKTTTPSRISFRTNPDGSRVSISRPPLPTNHQSPLISLRRASTDVISITSRTNK